MNFPGTGTGGCRCRHRSRGKKFTSTSMLTEVVLHADRGRFYSLRASRGNFGLIPRQFHSAHISRPYGLYGSETVLGVVPKLASRNPAHNYIDFILKRLGFSQGFQIQLQFLHLDILTKKCSQNLSTILKDIHVYTSKNQNFILKLLLKSVSASE